MELLKQLYAIHAPSQGERKIKRFIKRWVRENVPSAKIWCDNRNLYITKGVSDNGTYPCVVAHLDQVQKIHSDDFVAVETEDIIFGYSPSNRRREGLGADDKNGIWVALKCLQKYDYIKVAFFYGEEIGCLGSARAEMKFFDDVRFVVQPDRKGFKDLITEIGCCPICDDEFLKLIDFQSFGYAEQSGLMTDVETLLDNGLTVNCLNISCGYYEPHTDDEFTVKADLLNCLALVEHIIENVTERIEYEYESYGYYRHHIRPAYYDWYDDNQYEPKYSHNSFWGKGTTQGTAQVYKSWEDYNRQKQSKELREKELIKLDEYVSWCSEVIPANGDDDWFDEFWSLFGSEFKYISKETAKAHCCATRSDCTTTPLKKAN